MVSNQVKMGPTDTPNSFATSRAVTASMPPFLATRSAAFTTSSF